jgi:cation transport ATPase
MGRPGPWSFAGVGRTCLYVVVDGRPAGELALEDEVRPESKEAVDALHELGIGVAMITGDSQAVADPVARLGIDEVAAQFLPAEKADAVRRFHPVAGGPLALWGIDLPMAVGAIAMSLSTIVVAVNAQLLRRVRLQGESNATV